MTSQNSQANSVWHPEKPGLQVVWDATSLAAFSKCERAYKLHHIDGWSPNEDRIDLAFGSAFGAAMETFYKRIIEHGDGHEAAQRAALHEALLLSYAEQGAPNVFGAFEATWRCRGDKPYKNAKGNKAKCPYSHANKTFYGEGPTACTCGGTVDRSREWVSSNPVKDKLQLLRLVYFYTEHEKETNLRIMGMTAKGDDGTEQAMALAEVPWLVPMTSINGITFLASGWLDKVVQYGQPQEGGPVYISDLKTTKQTLSGHYFSQYAPNMQVSLYDFVGRENLGALQPRGVAIEAFQLLQGGVRYAVRTFETTDAQRLEFAKELHHLFQRILYAYDTQHYPRNPTACFLCPFKKVCALPPEARLNELKANFIRSRWNPLTRTREDLPDLPEAKVLPFRQKGDQDA